MQRLSTPQSGLVSGNVFNSFQKLNSIIEENDGVRNFGVTTNKCYNVEAPFTDNQETHIKITNNSQHDINQLSETYIRMELEADVHLDKIIQGQGAINIEHVVQILKPCEATLDPKPVNYDPNKFVINQNLEANAYYSLYGEKVDFTKIIEYLNENTSCLLLCCTNTADKTFDLHNVYYSGFKYEYNNIKIDQYFSIQNIVYNTINDDKIIEYIHNKITLPVSPSIHTWYDIDGNAISSYNDFIAKVGSGLTTFKLYPVIYATSTNLKVLVIHNYNNPFIKTKTKLEGLFGARVFGVYDLDPDYIKELYNMKDKNVLLMSDIEFFDSGNDYEFPPYQEKLPIAQITGHEYYPSPKDQRVIPNCQYWVRYKYDAILVSLYKTDGVTLDFEKDACSLFYDRMYREFDADFTWQFSQMTLEEFQKDVPIVPDACLFLGWKNSNEIIKQLQVDNNNVFTKYHQRESSKEGFCISTFKPNEEKKNNLFAHTSYSNARMGFAGVCGGYILFDPDKNPEYIDISPHEYNRLVTKTDFTVTGLQVILPIRDIACFSNFDEYPGALGDLVLKMYLNKQSMVWCQCDPRFTYDVTSFKKDINYDTAEEIYEKMVYNRGFTQVGQEARIVIDYQTGITGKNRLTVKELRCTKMTCECFGYNVTQDCKRELINLFTPDEPFLIPALQLDVVNFMNPIGGTDKDTSVYTSDLALAMRNVSKLVVVFPKNSTDTTTFTNPMIEKLHLKVNGKKYPDVPFDNTYDPRFYATMLRAADVGSFYEADTEFINSLTTKIQHDNRNTLTDVTSFLIAFQMERSSDGIFYDGLETKNENVNIQLEFRPSAEMKLAHRKYAPQLWILRETYWSADIQYGLRYWKTESPN